MSRQPRYFDLDGNEIDARHALDGHGALRDGVTLHIPLQLRDGLTPTQLSVRDAAARDARAQAYQRYDLEMGQMYKHGGSIRDAPTPSLWAQADPCGGSFEATGFGSRGSRGDQPGDLCTINGRPGRLKQVGGELRCVPDSRDSVGFTDHSGDPLSASRPGFRVRRGHDDRRLVQDAHDVYRTRLSNSYKLHDNERLCESCNGSGRNDNDDICDDCMGEGTVDDGGRSPDEAFGDTQTAHQDRNDSRSLSQRMHDHRSNMAQLYSQLDSELENAWRGGNK
jgi:hypothetical protein